MRVSRLTLLCCLRPLPILCPAQAKPSGPEPDEPIAVVAGQPIYERDLMSAIRAPGLLDLHKQEYKIEKRRPQSIDSRKKTHRGGSERKALSTEAFLKQEVDSKISDPSGRRSKGLLSCSQETRLPCPSTRSRSQGLSQLLKSAEVEASSRNGYAEFSA